VSKMELKQIIEDNFPSLLRCMDPSLDLLARLRSVPFVKDRVSLVNQQLTDDHKINTLLNVLCEVPDEIQESVMNGVVSALRSSNQKHVANIFRRESDEVPMSDAHYDKLTDNIDQLCLFADPENGLLDKLVSTKVISLTDAKYIRAMTGHNEKARKLIEILIRKSDDAFDGFINALNQTRQSHVTNMLTGEGNSRPLKDEYRIRLLTSKRDFLVKMIDSKSSGLITALMSKGVFSDYDEQRVTGVQPDTDYGRNEVTLDLIARKSQSDFFHFISALNDTEQTHVVVSLIGANVVAKIKTVYESETDGSYIPEVDAELLDYMREMFQRNGDVVRRLNELLSYNGVSVTDVSDGCIEITFTCENIESLSTFRDIYNSRTLEQLLNTAFCFQFAKKDLKVLEVVISAEQFEQCADMFARWLPITSEHREALLSSKERLVDKIRIHEDFLDKLSLCRRRRQAIERAATPEKQVKTLLDIVSRRPDSAFTQLISALKDTNQHEAAAIISADDSYKASELHETGSEDARNEVEHDLNNLLRLNQQAEAGCLDEGFWTVFKRICVFARYVAMSLQNQRERDFDSDQRKAFII